MQATQGRAHRKYYQAPVIEPLIAESVTQTVSSRHDHCYADHISLVKSIWLRSTMSPSAWASTRLLSAYGLIDDFMQFLEHLGDIGRIVLLLQLLIYSLDVIVPVSIGEGTRLHEQGLESYEYLPCHDCASPPGLIGGVERLHGIAQGLNVVKAPVTRTPASEWRGPASRRGLLRPPISDGSRTYSWRGETVLQEQNEVPARDRPEHHQCHPDVWIEEPLYTLSIPPQQRCLRIPSS